MGTCFWCRRSFLDRWPYSRSPPGYVSDLLGRKRTLLIAGLLHGIAFSMLTFVHGFWGVAAFEVVAALSVSLYSGTDVALQYDSLEALGEKTVRRKGLGQRLFWMQSGETLAALVGGWLVLTESGYGGPLECDRGLAAAFDGFLFDGGAHRTHGAHRSWGQPAFDPGTLCFAPRRWCAGCCGIWWLTVWRLCWRCGLFKAIGRRWRFPCGPLDTCGRATTWWWLWWVGWRIGSRTAFRPCGRTG